MSGPLETQQTLSTNAILDGFSDWLLELMAGQSKLPEGGRESVPECWPAARSSLFNCSWVTSRVCLATDRRFAFSMVDFETLNVW